LWFFGNELSGKAWTAMRSTTCAHLLAASALAVAVFAAVAALPGSVAALPSAQAATTFFDTFDGPAGAPGYPWLIHDAAPGTSGCKSFMYASCPARNNVFRSGSSSLVLRARREGTAYRGAMVGTFIYTGTWPPASRTLSWKPPFTVKVRARMPTSPAMWINVWFHSINQVASAGNFELDMAEERTYDQTKHNSYVHFFRGSTPVTALDWTCKLVLSSPLSQMHLYKMVVQPTSITTYVDDRLCGVDSHLAVPSGSAPLGNHAFGILLRNSVATPSQWGSGGFSPTGPGPWDMVVDYVSVTQN